MNKFRLNTREVLELLLFLNSRDKFIKRRLAKLGKDARRSKNGKFVNNYPAPVPAQQDKPGPAKVSVCQQLSRPGARTAGQTRSGQGKRLSTIIPPRCPHSRINPVRPR